jgi:hypothetical protein
MKKIALALVALMGVFATGCSDPCGDLKDCCVAYADAAGYDASVCDAYDEADSDACQAVIDAFEPVEGADLPAECEF